jgi:outer membrane protein TolC
MRKILFIIALPAAIYAQPLSALIDAALQNNHLVKASEYAMRAKAQELDAQKSDYYPTVDLGAAYVTLDKHISFQAGNTFTLYGKAGVDIFDGFRKSSMVKQKKSDYKASRYTFIHTKKALVRDIVHDFFAIKSAEASLRALQGKAKQLQADIEKITAFKKAGLAPQDYVDKLQAAYDANRYAIDSLKLNIRRMRDALSLKSGETVAQLEGGHIVDPKALSFEPSDALRSMQQQAEALNAAAKALDAIYYPNVRLEDTYSDNRYGRDEGLKKFGIEPIEKQNRVQLTAQMRLFDKGGMKKRKEALKLQRIALLERIKFRLKQERIAYELGKEALKTAQLKIVSAQSALRAAKSVYKRIHAKFSAGLVDQVTYLDALRERAEAQARYETAKNDFETAKADYYFAANRAIREYIK